jgi:hypothetical protein
MPMRRLAMLGAMPLLSLALLWGCENDTSNELSGPGGGNTTDKTCLGCHSSEQELKDALGIDGKARISAFHEKDG